ncbi:MAG TPA: hypothetical protein VMB21_18690 [Candidatus Limnocylindria bacterium]|nr:hypothetical protein [Candidatus Limnocylindria bacterium]
MKPSGNLNAAALLALLLAPLGAFAHEHLTAGVNSTSPGSPLIFANEADYGADTGYVFVLDAGEAGSPYAGYYYTGDLVLAALAATGDNGGPDPKAAALGTYVEAVIETVEGPVGGSFGFWETAVDDVDSTSITWSLPTGTTNAANHIVVSESDGSPGADPYGHKHGRIYSVTVPGLYKIGFRFVDGSTNGPGGGPIQAASDRYYLYLQGGLTVGGISRSADGFSVSFAAPSNIPDDDSAPATNYTLEASPVLGAAAAWQPVGDIVVGDDHLHEVPVPAGSAAQFFRLRAE